MTTNTASPVAGRPFHVFVRRRATSEAILEKVAALWDPRRQRLLAPYRAQPVTQKAQDSTSWPPWRYSL